MSQRTKTPPSKIEQVADVDEATEEHPGRAVTITPEDIDAHLPKRYTPEGEALAQSLGIDRNQAEAVIEAATEDMEAERRMGVAGVDDEDQLRVETYIRAVKKREYELQILKEQYEAECRRIQTRIDGLHFMHRSFAEAYVRRLIQQDHSKRPRKSVPFKFGVAGFRATPGKAKILDANAIIAWAREAGADDVIKTKVEVSQSGLTAYIQSTGDVPPGADHVPPGEVFYIK
jgi:phage host-nuclease inhibitor protein Gam